MRKSTIILLATLISSTGAWAEEIKKSDLLAAVKTYGENLGTVDSCMAQFGVMPNPKLSDRVEAAMFDKDLSTDSIEYFQKSYQDAYQSKVEEGVASLRMMEALNMQSSSPCNQITAEQTIQVRVGLEKKLLDLINKYKK